MTTGRGGWGGSFYSQIDTSLLALRSCTSLIINNCLTYKCMSHTQTPGVSCAHFDTLLPG